MRRQVETMSAYGIPEADISRVVGIDPKTLRKHYRDELDLAQTKANAQVAGYLFNAAKNGNVTAQIFWLKTRAKWRDAAVEFRHSGAIGRKDDLSQLSDEELTAMIVEFAPLIGLAPIKTVEESVLLPEPRTPAQLDEKDRGSNSSPMKKVEGSTLPPPPGTLPLKV